MSLLERFQAGSEFDSTGEFTLDESKAREKMARFQLVTNEEFLMLVVQAAVAAQCSSLAITLEGTEVRLVAAGALLDPESVRTIRAFLFDSQPDNIAYNLLAVASNAVEPSCQNPPLLAMVDNDLHFEANLRSRLGGLTATIKNRLAHLPCPLSLNGETLPTDPIGDEPRVVWSDSESSEITMVRYGVVVARQTQRLSLSFKAIVAGNNLVLDASFSHVVEDESYKAVIKTVSGRANAKLAEFVAGYQPDDSTAVRLLPHFLADHPDPAGAALDAYPLFPLADRAGYISLVDILALVSERGKVLTSQRTYNLQLSHPVVRIDNPALRHALETRLPMRAFEDADAEYIARAAAARNRAQWESSPRPTELPPGRYLCQAMVQGVTWEAAIGYLAGPGGSSRVDVLYQGKLLANEPLGEVPPGAAAVLNVRQGQVDPTWSRLDGRDYRAIGKELREKLRSLFRQQTFSDPAALYPALTDYLLSELRAGKPPTAAKTAPLFPVLGDSKALSFEQVSALETVAMGEPVAPFQRIPTSVLPVPLLEFSPERFQVLVARLGAPRVIDFRNQQKKLRAVDREMATPQPARLAPGDYLLQRPLSLGSCTGEIGLTPDFGTKLRVVLMKHGVVFENISVPGGRVLDAAVVVDVPNLELTPMWNGIARSTEYSKLLSDLSAAVTKLEQELLALDVLRPEVRIKLLRTYPQAKESYWNQPLMATTSYGTFASLAQLEAELLAHGHLLRGEPGIAVPERIALVSPGKETLSFLADALNCVIPWEEAAVALRAYQQAREFEDKPEVSQVELAGRYPVRLPLPSGRGEIAFQMSDARAAGGVNCYVRGRFVCRKMGVIPSPFVAAVESEAFVLSRDFQDVSVPDSVKAMLLDMCALCMLEAAVHSDFAVRGLAWDYFGRGNTQTEHQARFRELINLTKLNGESISLAAVATSKIQGYVGPRFSTKIAAEGLVLRLKETELERLRKYLGKSLFNVEEVLLDQQAYQRKRESLPTQISSKLYQKTYEEGAFKATLGVSTARRTVGLDAEGRPVGMLRQLRMPVQAVVYGAFPDPKKKGTDPVAQLPSKGYDKLSEWADQLCLDWVQEKADDRKLIIHLLSLSTREIASRDDRPLSAMATILWDMPLFSRVDGTRVSGSALAAALSETKEPIPISAVTFRVPDPAIYLPEGSEELQILSAVLGKDSLRWHEAPPLVNTAEMGKSIKRLVSWGLTPIGKSLAAVGRLWEKTTDGQEEKKPEKKPEPKARDPREVLVVQLKEDIRNLLGREHFRKSDELFKALDFGTWPLGPPIYRQRGGGPFRLNSLHAGIRWLLDGAGNERHKRAARMMLVVHWVGLVNLASSELTDTHEDEFLISLAERLTQTFAQN